MLDPVYCVSCKKPIEPAWPNCPHCGTSQKASSPSAAVLPPAAPPPVYVVQQVVNPDIIVAECTRQYQNLTWLSFAGVFLFTVYFLGLAMIIYAMVQKPALRRKVAELGLDPEAWESPLRAQSNRLMLICFALVAAIGVAGLLLMRPR